MTERGRGQNNPLSVHDEMHAYSKETKKPIGMIEKLNTNNGGRIKYQPRGRGGCMVKAGEGEIGNSLHGIGKGSGKFLRVSS